MTEIVERSWLDRVGRPGEFQISTESNQEVSRSHYFHPSPATHSYPLFSCATTLLQGRCRGSQDDYAPRVQRTGILPVRQPAAASAVQVQDQARVARRHRSLQRGSQKGPNAPPVCIPALPVASRVFNQLDSQLPSSSVELSRSSAFPVSSIRPNPYLPLMQTAREPGRHPALSWDPLYRLRTPLRYGGRLFAMSSSGSLGVDRCCTVRAIQDESWGAQLLSLLS